MVSQKVSESKHCGKPKSKQKVSIESDYPCRFCEKKFNHKQSRYRHELKCKLENNKKENNLELVKMIEDMKKQNDELKDMLQKALKIHPKTLQKINNQLNNINNGVINNFNIIPLGKENLDDIMTNKEKKLILFQNANCINELIELNYFLIIIQYITNYSYNCNTY
jgi:hypothetical protein